MTQTCTACGETKPADEFYVRRDRKPNGPRGGTGRMRRCRTCWKAYYKARRQSHPEERAKQNAYKQKLRQEQLAQDPDYDRRRNLRRLYGISLDEFDALLARQGGVCAICNGPAQGKDQQYHVDHDHSTGKVRGLLCHKCNVALGMVGDCVEHLDALRRYLELAA